MSQATESALYIFRMLGHFHAHTIQSKIICIVSCACWHGSLDLLSFVMLVMYHFICAYDIKIKYMYIFTLSINAIDNSVQSTQNTLT